MTKKIEAMWKSREELLKRSEEKDRDGGDSALLVYPYLRLKTKKKKMNVKSCCLNSGPIFKK